MIIHEFNCKVCGKLDKSINPNKIYCGGDCSDLYTKLISCKELFRLSDDDKILRLKLLEAKKDE